MKCKMVVVSYNMHPHIRVQVLPGSASGFVVRTLLDTCRKREYHHLIEW